MGYNCQVRLFSCRFLLAFCIVLLTACSSVVKQNGLLSSSEFKMASVVKTDINLVTETHQKIVFLALKELALKLYKRNPSEWRKGGYKGAEEAVTELVKFPFMSINDMKSIDCIWLSVDDGFEGDRVQAFIAGLQTMIFEAYQSQREFYMIDFLDAQKLYNSARNVEVASWLIRTKQSASGAVFLVSSGDAEEVNLSFERLFGKIINAQDMIAQIMANRQHRVLKSALQSMVTAFIPI
ncbi:MAG: hypothetical protein HOF12_04795 [Methylococcales bacterium]|nr:hypothetical protein [Methylococcales bacterium]